jgi:hypothetical protein
MHQLCVISGLAMERRNAPRSLVSDSVAGSHPFRSLPQLRSELLLVTGETQERLRLVGSLWDVSESGASFVCPWRSALLDLPPGQPMELIVRYENLNLHLDADLRHARNVSGKAVVLGMRFRRTETSAESLDHWPGLLWELRCRGGLRDTAAALGDAA